ncbi:GNAT family N-acetyltransferase [Amycolatopsis coloradensis]|uniref:GNAT family N-acetyltransferase n=1 Tax=Amycolatopsis coloradensis TaxID=76021 RepID=A0ACD5BKQ6_9PSEU
MPAFRIHPATADRFGDVATILDPNGNDRACWCLAYRAKPADYSRLRGDERAEHVRGLCAADPAPGVLAYDGTTPVGRCGVGPRAHLHRMTRSRTMPPIDDAPAWTVVCFVVRSGHRRKGVAHALLDGAVSYARAHGAPVIEGYPVDPGEGRINSSAAHIGTIGLFAAAGFELVAPDTVRTCRESHFRNPSQGASRPPRPELARRALRRVRCGEGRLQPTQPHRKPRATD